MDHRPALQPLDEPSAGQKRRPEASPARSGKRGRVYSPSLLNPLGVYASSDGPAPRSTSLFPESDAAAVRKRARDDIDAEESTTWTGLAKAVCNRVVAAAQSVVSRSPPPVHRHRLDALDEPLDAHDALHRRRLSAPARLLLDDAHDHRRRLSAPASLASLTFI